MEDKKFLCAFLLYTFSQWARDAILELSNGLPAQRQSALSALSAPLFLSACDYHFQVLNESLPDDERPLLKFDYLCKCDKLCEVQVYLVIRCVKF